MPIVTKKILVPVLKKLSEYSTFSLDLETTGLNPYKGDKLFSLIISTLEEDYYFNFNEERDHLGQLCPDETILPRRLLGDILLPLEGAKVYVHNAKFDQRFLLSEGFNLDKSNVVCTQSLSRLVNNTLPSYSLANLGELIGHKKDDTVEKYISKHKLYTLVDVGKAKPRKDKHFNLVPFEIISKYGLQDGRACFELGEYVTKRLREMDAEQIKLGLPPLMPLVYTEIGLTKVLLEMEHTGIKINEQYTREAYEHALDLVNEAEEKFLAVTGLEFEDRPTVLKEAFKRAGLEHGYTTKGNASFSDANLPDNTIGDLIRQQRHAYKQAHTYYRNFLDLADKDGAIHCNFVQGGTTTGRMSCREPNLQNVPKHGEDSNKYPIRGCFVPREDYFFLMVDYDQQEYRLLLDVAGEDVLIEKVLSGLDVHSATGELCLIERQDAKQVNFAQVYGQGLNALADSLGKSVRDTKIIRSTYFRNLKKVKGFINQLTKMVSTRGFVVNPLGRRLQRPLYDYQIANHYIQGACGDIVKKAMVEIHEYLKDKKSRMLISIHDEVLLEIHKSEEHLIPEIVEIMRGAYQENSLPLTAGSDVSFTNWYDKCPLYTGDLSLPKLEKLGVRYKNAWDSIRGQRERCNKENNKAYKHYGAKGIRVEYSTRAFISWYVNEAKKYPEDLPLNVDRIDHDKNYTFSNVRLIPKSDNIAESNRRRAKK